MYIKKTLSVFLIFSTLLYSQTPQESAEKAYLANINTLLIFTSESGLSSGRYRFTKSDFKMETYTLPYTHHFQPFDKNMNWFISGTVGYSVTRLDTITTDSRKTPSIDLRHDNKLQTYTAGLGGGLRYKTYLDIDLLMGAELIYSRVITSVTPNDDIGDAVEGFFDGEYNDNLTYKFLLGMEYVKEYKSYKPYIKANFKVYETKSDFTLHSLTNFNSQSNILSLSIGVETPSLLKYENNYLTTEPYIKFNHLNGDITTVTKIDNYINLGITTYWNTPKNPQWAKRFFLEMSTVKAEGLEGYSLGLGFKLDF